MAAVEFDPDFTYAEFNSASENNAMAEINRKDGRQIFGLTNTTSLSSKTLRLFNGVRFLRHHVTIVDRDEVERFRNFCVSHNTRAQNRKQFNIVEA
ncbi:MAG: hypothetical protein Q9M91_05525 [Candidatus Dojkabacteria bacterium]|nr:hypothetical protein [Candidatus Dojkabacteria bacterium]